ncbi:MULTISPECIES: prolyl aminopeptidase [Actinomadura]|uniref:Proline iminopeptidase n=1 Tax=Actinomadura yumaensis TaxID=111807 RepID=A0ABW2D1D0_9ACTN|nr:prolyl aminopeptidase [Actinomadura sp. J1-007]MWK38005.1 prolyl aminopeptidase [Actinomadura sp. J1-007]
MEPAVLYPPIEPYDAGFLDVGGGHELYWETCGNPEGRPALYLQSVPGGGCGPVHRRLFDPDAYRLVMFDQRNSGQSRPHAGDPVADLTTNTTAHTIGDIERLRELLGIDRWLLFGGGWGSALALAYGQEHPERATGFVLRGVRLYLPNAEAWFLGAAGVARLYPEIWEAFRLAIPEAERSDLMNAYARLLADPDPAVHLPAARAWILWEDVTSTLIPREPEEDEDARSLLAVARVENHYFRNGFFLQPAQLLRGVSAISHLPAVIINGRYDLLTPPDAAWRLHQAWPGSDLHLVPAAGHSFDEPGILERLVQATDAFAAET